MAVFEMDRKSPEMVLHWRSIPWLRVLIDTLLVVGILLASANLLSVR